MCCVNSISPTTSLADQAEDEAAIRKNAEAYVEAYNNRDTKALAAMWTTDAVYTDLSTGESTVGREEIEKSLADTLADFGDAKLEVSVHSIEFASPSVAIENGTVRLMRPNEPPMETNYKAVNVKKDGQWFLDRLSEQESPASPPSNYEHLKELEWMIGTWIDEDERATIQTDCAWTKNRNFMTRSFAIVIGDEVDMAGMQIIGWDPVAKQIRSWVFDSDGGFSEGTWARKDNRWLVQQTGTLPDGRRSSAVNIFTMVDDSSFTWQSGHREVDGEVLPNVDEVLVVRQPSN
jgi:uncharacterized protein (TIGR02246 family)